MYISKLKKKDTGMPRHGAAIKIILDLLISFLLYRIETAFNNDLIGQVQFFFLESSSFVFLNFNRKSPFLIGVLDYFI